MGGGRQGVHLVAEGGTLRGTFKDYRIKWVTILLEVNLYFYSFSFLLFIYVHLLIA